MGLVTDYSGTYRDGKPVRTDESTRYRPRGKPGTYRRKYEIQTERKTWYVPTKDGDTDREEKPVRTPSRTSCTYREERPSTFLNGTK